MPNQPPRITLHPAGAVSPVGPTQAFAPGARGNDLIQLSTGALVALVQQSGAISVQRFDSAGTPLGPLQSVGTGLSSGARPTSYAQLTDLGAGKFAVTWVGTGPDDDSGIQTRLFNADGTPLTAVLTVNTTVAGTQSAPVVSSTSDGGLFVAWRNDAGGMFGQRLDSAGTKTGSEFTVLEAGSTNTYPTDAILLADGRNAVAGRGATAQIFLPDGSPLGSSFDLPSQRGSGPPGEPTIVHSGGELTALANGNFAAVWTTTYRASEDRVLVRVFTADGVPLTLQATVGLGLNVYPVETVILANGNFLVAVTTGNELQGQIFDGQGAAVTGRLALGSANTFDPHANSPASAPTADIVALADGGFAIAWLAGSTAQARAYTNTGAPVGAALTLGASANSLGGIAALPDGSFVVTFDGNEAVVGPGQYKGFSQVGIDLKGSFELSDPDAGAGTITVTLQVGSGTLAVTAGGSGAMVAGSGTGTVTLTGTLAQIAALLNTDGTSTVAFTPSAPDQPATTTLTVTVDDNGNTGGPPLSTNDSATIVVAPDAAPVVTPSAGTVSLVEPDNSVPATVLVDSAITVADSDSARLPSATVRITGGYAAGQDVLSLDPIGGTFTSSFDSVSGTLTITAGASDSITDSVLRAVRFTNASNSPTGGTRTIEFVVSDGIESNAPVSKQLALTPTNDLPVIDLNGAAAGTGSAVSYSEAAATPVALAPTATLVEVDTASYDGGNLTVAQSARTDADARLSVISVGSGAGEIGVSGSTVSYGGTAIGTISGGSGLSALVVSLNGAATPEAVAALIRQVGYANVNADPPLAGPQFRFSLYDGIGATSAQVFADVTNVGGNGPPVVTTSGGIATVVEPASSGDASIAVDSSITVSDPEGDRMTSATIQFTAGYVAGEDVLVYTGSTSGITQSFDPLLGVLTLTAAAPVGITATVLRQVHYRNTSDDPNTSPRTVSFVVSDGQALSAAATKTVTITASDDPIVLDADPLRSGTGDVIAHLVGGRPTPVAPDMVIIDPDSSPAVANGLLSIVVGSTTGAPDRVSILSSGNGAGQIGVSGNSVSYGGTVIGSFSGAGTPNSRLDIALNGDAAPDAVQALTRAIAYHYDGTAPTQAVSHVTFYFDPAGSAPTVTSTVTITQRTEISTVFQAPEASEALFGSGPAAGGWSSQDTSPRVLADVNGDGRADIVGFGYDHVYAMFAKSDGSFEHAAVYVLSSGFVASPSGGGWTSQDQYPRTFADVNGDRRADLVAFGEEGVSVALSTGTAVDVPFYALHAFGAGAGAGGWSSFDRNPRLLADVNGDGHADIVGFGEEWVYVALGQADGAFQQPVQSLHGFAASEAGGGWSSFEAFPRALADVNGDGRADIVGFGSAGVYVALAQGDGTFVEPTFDMIGFGASPSAGGWSSFDAAPRMVGDVNGDRFADIVGFGSAGVVVSLGRGDGTFLAPELERAAFGSDLSSGGWTSQDVNPRFLGDYTGDGILDIVGFGDSGIFLADAVTYG